MKRKFSFIIVSLLLISGTTFAAKSAPIIIQNPSFAPVAWHATLSNGGFSIENQTNKSQYVQVSIETGEIAVYTIKGGTLGTCHKDLDATTGPYSVVCELAPNDRLDADIDYAKMAEATGAYQIKMQK